MPIHSQLLTNIDTKRGGIGITSPRLKAIPSFVLATKTTLDTIYNGVYLGKHRKRYILPQPITLLYENQESNPSKLLQIFNKFGPEIATTCTKKSSDQMDSFITSTSLANCHEQINSTIASRLQQDVIPTFESDSKHNIEEILDGKLGQGLLDLPRYDQKNRQPNNLFRFNLLRCLRLNIWESNDELICPLCKQNFDKKGDHLFQCSKIGKKTNTKMHDKWNLSWQEKMNRLMPLIKLSDSKAMKEQTGLVKSLQGSRVRPFDTHINLPTVSDDGHFRCKLQKIGFDMILCNSDTCPPPSRGGSDAKSNSIITSLITAEKSKFQRGKAINKARTCHATGITISGEEIIRELFASKQQLLPFAISPLGLFGPTINKFLFGKTIQSTNFHNINSTSFPNAFKMAKRALSNEVPSNILGRANEIWRRQHPTENFGRSYKSPDPETYYSQMFGRDVCFANGSAGLEAIALLGDGPLTKSSPNVSCHNGALSLFTNCTDTNAFHRIIDRNAESPQCPVMTEVPTTAHIHNNLTT